MSIQESTDADDSPCRRAAATPPAALHGPPWGAVAGPAPHGRVLGSSRRMVAAAVIEAESYYATNQFLSLTSQERIMSETVGQAAERMYPDVTFDTALPQTWVDAHQDDGTEVLGHFVWLYPSGSTFGMPAPITVEGVQMMYRPDFT